MLKVDTEVEGSTPINTEVLEPPKPPSVVAVDDEIVEVFEPVAGSKT